MKGGLFLEKTIEQKIYRIRGQKVMLSIDLAQLYDVEVRALIQAVKRNKERFPNDFMFQLSWKEVQNPRSQNVILKSGKNIKYLPYAFTEQGVAMLSSVLKSKRAIQVNVAIMRAFVKLRRILGAHKELTKKLRELEGHVGKHDREIQLIFEAIRQLMSAPPPEPSKQKIGFR